MRRTTALLAALALLVTPTLAGCGAGRVVKSKKTCTAGTTCPADVDSGAGSGTVYYLTCGFRGEDDATTFTHVAVSVETYDQTRVGDRC